ncbi:hypothetical protein H072_5440 [Dactylellina haptotyla CBS 200.50]|uniref:Uncharacterized protein n=1 Tax=Dactylellina haptotyla (strain CBS 200.50) TaxID=1284197 RepID=S8ACB9_DACHA|nr:hypothetical protein H072_5440 [Dactylellina haptotyla CBS 200.50]
MLWNALKNRHWIVLTSTIALVTLNISTIFATGLFVLQVVGIESKGFINYTHQFSVTGFNPFSLDSTVSFTAFGVSSLNLTYPAGTNKQNAFQSFSFLKSQTPPLSNTTSISAPADVFSAKLDCQIANLTWDGSAKDPTQNVNEGLFYNTTAFVSGCTLKNLKLDTPPGWAGDFAQEGYYAIAVNSTCEELKTKDPVSGYRLFFAINYSTRAISTYSNVLQNYSAVVCKPSYTFQHSQVTINGNDPNDSTQVSAIKPLGDIFILPGLTGEDLSDSVLQTLAAGSSQVVSWTVTKSFDAFFTIMELMHSNQNYTAFMTPEILRTACSDTFSALGAQVAKSYLTTPVSTTVETTFTINRQRLVLQLVSVIIMDALLAILIILTIILLVSIPQEGVTPGETTSLAAFAAILSKSSGLERSLTGTSAISTDDLKTRLQNYKYFTTNNAEGDNGVKCFKVEAVETLPESEEPKHTPAELPADSWWVPSGLKWWALTILIIVPIAIIVVLEVLYRISLRDNGLLFILTGGYIHYAWVYIPATTMTVLVALAGTVDQASRAVAPYNAMRDKPAAARSGIMANPVGKLTLPALWYAFTAKQITLVATMLIVLLAPFLKIAVSGLYTSRLVDVVEVVSVQQTSWFNSSQDWADTTSTLENIISSLIVTANLSYPKWTYENLAFAELVLPNNRSSKVGDTVTVDTPALRPTLNCTVFPKDRYLSLTIGSSAYKPGPNDPPLNLTALSIYYNISMPNGCGNSAYYDSDFLWLTGSINHPETGYFGVIGSVGTTKPQCQGIIVNFGHMQNNKIENFTTVLCKPLIQSLTVKTTFLLPNFTIDASNTAPPEILESTAKTFSNQSSAAYYAFGKWEPKNAQGTNTLDPFMTALVYGKDGTPLNELLDNDILIEKVTRQYGIVAAQAVSQHIRVPESAETGNNNTTVISGDGVGKSRARLVQTEPATRVLQAVLGLMILTSIVVWFGVNGKALLPRESNNIATTGGFLAGSDVLRLVPEGANLKQTSSEWFKGHLFGFGWWEDTETGESKRRYGVGIGKSL